MHLRTDTGQQAHFSRVPTISRSRNAFSIAKKHVTTTQFDYLYPVYTHIIYPGDTLSIAFKALGRLQTQIAPLYDDLYLDAHAWFVPMRLIQTNWARYQFNAQPGGPAQDNSSLTAPTINLTTLGSGGFASKSLYDYLGFPTKINFVGSGQNINNYKARAYNLIWNNDYRDENLQNPVTVDLTEGPDDPGNYVLLKRGRRHDLFSSCLPFQQKGAAVTIPLGTSANVLRKSNAGVWTLLSAGFNTPASAGTHTTSGLAEFQSNGANVSLDPQGGLYADLSTATAATLNQLRQSIAVQQLLEADARGGTRDVESIQHRWGVTVPDFRLQRPEFLGSATWSFDGHIVPQTSATGTTGSTTPQAYLTQFSQSLSVFNVTHSFVEHGVFMILLSARSNLTYQQGLDRENSYYTRYDWYQPEFANLGEVAVKNKEIMAQGVSAGSADDSTFGFQEYAYELRYQRNLVTGEMRSNYTTPLDSRHMADNYASLPTLSAGWIANNTPISRNISVSAATADPIQLSTLTEGSIARTLPMFSIPGLMRL